LSDFEQIGWVRLHNAFDPSGMAEAMWQALGEHGLRPHDPTTWTRLGGEALSQKWLTKFGKSGAFAGVASDALAAALTGLLGDGWTEEAGGWGRPLITFPTAGSWDVPVEGWHLDAPPAEPFHTVRMFAYLSDVEQHGGGTLVAEGSHRLAAAYPNQRSRAIRDRLSEDHPWFREIWRPTDPEHRLPALMDAGVEIRGVRVRIVEITGQPGDVVLWHPSLFHAAALNVSDRPRFMLTHTAARRLAFNLTDILGERRIMML
jgi:hypothetical protein